MLNKRRSREEPPAWITHVLIAAPYYIFWHTNDSCQFQLSLLQVPGGSCLTARFRGFAALCARSNCLRWLHRAIIYGVARWSLMSWILLLHSFLHPVLSNLQHVISNDQISLLKFWVLLLNYKCPNKIVSSFFYGFICDFLEFPSVKSTKIFTEHRILLDTKLKHEKSRVRTGSFFVFCKFMSFTAAKKTGLIDFSWKRAPTKIKYLLPVCQILRNFTEGSARKFTVFCFLYSCWLRHKISKNTDIEHWARADYLSFRPQRAYDRKPRGSHLKQSLTTTLLKSVLTL